VRPTEQLLNGSFTYGNISPRSARLARSKLPGEHAHADGADEFPGGGRRRFTNPESKDWLERMAAEGWTAPTWPGLRRRRTRQRRQLGIAGELRRRCAAAARRHGIVDDRARAARIRHAQQKAEHLPKIARGEIWWCQGYSEPNAGSDLASLKTRAVDNGDEYLISGSKIWTSGADHADWIFCLVRTDPNAPKHDGITFILFDMNQPGVTVRPIPLISGASPFCETFFDNARALKKNVVGDVNKGWTVAKRLLQYERTSIGGIGGGTQQSARLEDLARQYAGVSPAESLMPSCASAWPTIE
jgi:acyl-CoA dehydrogenase